MGRCLGGVIVFVLLWVISGCTRGDSSIKQRPHVDDRHGHRHSEISRERARFERVNAAPLPPFDVERYDLRGEYDWQARRLNATVSIAIRLKDPNLTTITLNSRVDQIHSVRWHSTNVPFEVESDGHLKISLVGPGHPPATDVLLHISYEARSNGLAGGEPSGLIAVASRTGDPNPARVVYTVAEPLGADEWMPCHNDPRDRAVFSADFKMANAESLIANGDLLVDEWMGGQRHMRYATRYSLPTYLMAFAVGDFAQTTIHHGILPVSVWTRRGVTVDSAGLLNELVRYIGHFEGLLGAYPFEKYALVLLPEFPAGGVEHASITFQGETVSTQGALSTDLNLSAHELAHQWFGDYVTIESWDDLWIKEGMATLLAEESSRHYEDRNKSGRLFGAQFVPHTGEAIQDVSLDPEDKYTSGPYDRAAWLLTQLRSQSGEANFWEAIRTVLKRNAWGYIGSTSFLEAFRPYVDASLIEKAKIALTAKELPKLEVKEAADGKAALHVTDKAGGMVVPLEYRRYRLDGSFESGALTDGSVLPLPAETDKLLVLDPKDVHGLSAFGLAGKEYETHLLPRLVPQTLEAKKIFSALSSSVHSQALSHSGAWNIEPADARNWIAGFSAETVRYVAIQRLCEVASKKSTPASLDAWKSAIASTVLFAPTLGMPGRNLGLGFSSCSAFLSSDLFATQWMKLQSQPEVVSRNETELIQLSLVPIPAGKAFSLWRNVVEKGASIRSRLTGWRALRRHLLPLSGFESVAAGDIAQWKSFYRWGISSIEASEIQEVIVEGMLRMKDYDAFPLLAKAIMASPRPSFQLRSVCAVYGDLHEDEATWKNFVRAFGPLDPLSTVLRETIETPDTHCGD